MHTSHLILASVSPRRRNLLLQLGLKFEIFPSSVDEIITKEVSPAEHVMILAERKARDVGMKLSTGIILGADTIVVIDGEILNKPKDEREAIWMLQRLSGRMHEVFTGFSLLEIPSGRCVTEHEHTEVWFRELNIDEISRYVASGSPLDKAGAYGIQDDFGAVFVKKIHGDYYNVVGLPLSHFYCSFMSFTKNEKILP